jgi:hypothetical protein
MLDVTERPPIATAPISVVLGLQSPTDALEALVAEWAAYLDTLQREHEIVLVDDTGAAAGDPGRAPPPTQSAVTIIRHSRRQGLGAILRSGLAAAGHPLVFYTLASGRYVPADLGHLLKVIDRVDLATGYRLIPFRQRRQRFARATYRWLLRMLFGLRVRDADCHYLLARRSIFRRIPIQSDGDFAHVEILAKANFLGCLMTDVPVSYRAEGDVSASPWRRHVLGELRQVFSRPDFGPAVLAPVDTAGGPVG